MHWKISKWADTIFVTEKTSTCICDTKKFEPVCPVRLQHKALNIVKENCSWTWTSHIRDCQSANSNTWRSNLATTENTASNHSMVSVCDRLRAELWLTVGQSEGLDAELVAASQARFGEQLVHGHNQVALGHTTHSVQHLLKVKSKSSVTKTTTIQL